MYVLHFSGNMHNTAFFRPLAYLTFVHALTIPGSVVPIVAKHRKLIV